MYIRDGYVAIRGWYCISDEWHPSDRTGIVPQSEYSAVLMPRRRGREAADAADDSADIEVAEIVTARPTVYKRQMATPDTASWVEACVQWL
jgi:hypothetical protein